MTKRQALEQWLSDADDTLTDNDSWQVDNALANTGAVQQFPRHESMTRRAFNLGSIYLTR